MIGIQENTDPSEGYKYPQNPEVSYHINGVDDIEDRCHSNEGKRKEKEFKTRLAIEYFEAMFTKPSKANNTQQPSSNRNQLDWKRYLYYIVPCDSMRVFKRS